MKHFYQLKFWGLALCLVFSINVLAQTGTVSGKILDNDTGEPVIGANAVIQGTVIGAITDLDGSFRIGDVPAGSQTLVVSFIGYQTMEINVDVSSGQDTSLGTLNLLSGAIGLAEVSVYASVAIDRKTPVAVSTIKAKEIESKIGSQEFPEILKSTPGVFATKAGGGFGDGRINVRGFDSQNVAVMINGVPVNDMENGRVYWSNWAGLTDATQIMQVQRGLGAAKIAVPAIGGTINIISKATDMEQGGSVYLATGNDAYSKIGFELSSGLTESGWAVTLSGAKTQGDGYVDGTEFLSFSYYANIAKKINDSHELTFTAIGAKQNHGQREDQYLLEVYEDSDRGIKFNGDWGYKKGQVVHIEDNFYHKPQLSLNHYWTINNSTELSTALYASWGSGGGGGTLGENKFNDDAYRVDGVVDLDRIVAENQALGSLGSESILRASRNDHSWYGLLSTFKKDVNESLSILAGLDLRYYNGKHFREVTDLLGGEYWLDDDNINNPVNAAKVGDKIDYHDEGIVNWVGGFVQAEYTRDKLSSFVSAAISNTGYSRIDHFLYLDSDPIQEVGTFNFLGYMIKGGAIYNLNSTYNVFANVGYFEKAPGFDAVFPNFTNETINEDAENQKIFSAEVGLGIRKSNLTANINVYHTQWKDRTFTSSFPGMNGEDLVANILGVNALHQGIEVDGVWKFSNKLKATGMISYGNWIWQNNLVDVPVFEGNNQIGTVNAFIADLHVGDAAQTTAALGISYFLLPELRLAVDYNYYDRLFAQYDPITRNAPETEGVEAWQIPAWGTFDLNVTYDFDFGEMDATMYGNVYNITNTQYVADATDGGTADASRVFYGFGTTWNLGVRIRF